MPTAIVLGATGAIGQQLVTQLTQRSEVESVIVITRRELDLALARDEGLLEARGGRVVVGDPVRRLDDGVGRQARRALLPVPARRRGRRLVVVAITARMAREAAPAVQGQRRGIVRVRAVQDPNAADTLALRRCAGCNARLAGQEHQWGRSGMTSCQGAGLTRAPGSSEFVWTRLGRFRIAFNVVDARTDDAGSQVDINGTYSMQPSLVLRVEAQGNAQGPKQGHLRVPLFQVPAAAVRVRRRNRATYFNQPLHAPWYHEESESDEELLPRSQSGPPVK